MHANNSREEMADEVARSTRRRNYGHKGECKPRKVHNREKETLTFSLQENVSPTKPSTQTSREFPSTPTLNFRAVSSKSSSSPYFVLASSPSATALTLSSTTSSSLSHSSSSLCVDIEKEDEGEEEEDGDKNKKEEEEEEEEDKIEHNPTLFGENIPFGSFDCHLVNGKKMKFKPLSSAHKAVLIENLSKKNFILDKLPEWLDILDNKSFLSMLRFNKEFNSQHISTYFGLLEQRSGVPCLPFSFNYKLGKNAKMTAVRNKVKSLMQINEGFILVPIHEPYHWILVIVHIEQHKLLLYDSLQLFTTSFPKLAALESLLNFEVKEPLKWEVVPMRCPVQENVIDCGVHVCINALTFVCGGFWVDIEQRKVRDFIAQMRFVICYSIIYSRSDLVPNCNSNAFIDQLTSMELVPE